MDVREKVAHTAFGQIISEELKRAGVKIKDMCKEIHMGPGTYSLLKRGAIAN